MENNIKIQRDLYSVFLLMNSTINMDKPDRELCEKTYNHFKEMHDYRNKQNKK